MAPSENQQHLLNREWTRIDANGEETWQNRKPETGKIIEPRITRMTRMWKEKGLGLTCPMKSVFIPSMPIGVHSRSFAVEFTEFLAMKAEWHRVEEVFLSALEHSVEERIAFVRAACAGDASLQEEVEALLRSHEETESFLEQPAYQVNAELFADDEGSLKAGESFGEYRILSLLGEGGMGAVYLAEDTTLGRRVALKLVKSGPGRASLVRHFHREERILAGLTHPNIARLYGGAVTPEGTPYFVMEYVEGERLDSYCDRRRAADSGAARTLPEDLFRGLVRPSTSRHSPRPETSQYSRDDGG